MTFGYKDFVFRTLDKQSPGWWTNIDGSITNPGLIVHKREIYLAYRAGNIYWRPTNVIIGKVDGTFTPTSPFKLVQFNNVNPEEYNFEDPRFFIWRDELYVSMVLVHRSDKELKWVKMVVMKYPEMIWQVLHYPRCQFKQFEKNWVFFDYNGELYCTYTLHHGFHAVCKVNGNAIDLAYITEYKCPEVFRNSVRGTSNLVMRDGLWWGVAHTSVYETSNVKDKATYHSNALFYAMEPEPPFRIVQIQQEPFIHNDDVNDIEIKFCQSIFPSGLISENKDTWVVGAGINDVSMAFLRIPHSLVLDTCDSA